MIPLPQLHLNIQKKIFFSIVFIFLLSMKMNKFLVKGFNRSQPSVRHVSILFTDHLFSDHALIIEQFTS